MPALFDDGNTQRNAISQAQHSSARLPHAARCPALLKIAGGFLLEIFAHVFMPGGGWGTSVN